MALYSAKPGVGISECSTWFIFSAQNTVEDWDFHRKLLLLGHLLQLIFMIFQSSYIGFK